VASSPPFGPLIRDEVKESVGELTTGSKLDPSGTHAPKLWGCNGVSTS
jgi:hypothetical protein